MRRRMAHSDVAGGIDGPIGRLRDALERKGVAHVIRSMVKESLTFTGGLVAIAYHRMFRSRAGFIFEGRTYRYFYHRYGRTWRNERTVEVPIIWEMVRMNGGKSILEIGNVLPNYFSFGHDVVDKYEKARGVINCDIVDFHPPKKYDLIVSISTLEHIGWDENPREPEKVLRAISNLRSLLSAEGRIAFTVPVGQNIELDRFISESKIQLTEKFYLKRISASNKWKQVDAKDARDATYNSPFPKANAVVVGIIENACVTGNDKATNAV